MSWPYYELTKQMVILAREVATRPPRAKNEMGALIEREYRRKAWSELIRWKKQVPELVPETNEELQEGLNKS